MLEFLVLQLWNRQTLFSETLTHGLACLVASDIRQMFHQFKEATDDRVLTPKSADHLARRIRAALGAKPAPEILEEIRAWEKSLPENDWRRGILDPETTDESVEAHHPGESWEIDPDKDREAVFTSIAPDPAALLRLATSELNADRFGEAVRLLASARWITLRDEIYEYGLRRHRIGGRPIFLEVHYLLESALGLQALEKGDVEAAQKRFRNLCAMGSLDHRLGGALFERLSSSGQKRDAEALFSTRWNQLEAILEIAPRDAGVCRALADWSNSCGNRRASAAAVFAELADSLEKEQEEHKAYLKRFEW